MRRWRKTVNIKAIMDNDALDYAEQGRTIVALLKKHPEFADHDEGMLLEEMEDAVAEIEENGTLEWFNACLAGVYDVADSCGIWMGP